jgi:hypothetical protein
MINLLQTSRVAGLFMPVVFAVAIIFCLVRVGQTATREYFAEKPVFEWQAQHATGNSHGSIIWRTPDLDAEWKVVYHRINDSRWLTAPAKLTGLVQSDLLTRQRIYDAELPGRALDGPLEYSVFRNRIQVFCGRILAAGERLQARRP